MKFDYKESEAEGPEAKAFLHLFNGGPELCLAVKTNNPDKVVWFYENGDTLVQPSYTLDGCDLVKKFYKGDTITLTF